MTIKLSFVTRNARLSALATAVGASPILKIRTGSAPSTCQDADTGSVVVSIALSSSWADTASGGIMRFVDLPGTFTAIASGIGDHFRLYKSDGSTCMLQGSVTLTGGGGNITMSDNNMVSGASYNIDAFALKDGNA